MNLLKRSLAAAGMAAAVLAAPATQAQSTPQSVEHMQKIIEAIKSGKLDALPDAQRKAVESGMRSANASSNLDNLDQKVVDFSIKHASQWQQMAREAYVAALPPRDRARGESVLLGDGTLPDSEGRLYYFVSRSMPMSLLKAYAVEALHTGGTLVVKGIRRGDTIKEYVEEAVADFNNAEGQVLSNMEINPNLFDMFDVSVVPTVVWTNKIGLDDIGAGCENLPEGTPVPLLTVEGPDGNPLQVEKPVCAQAPSGAYYKIAGALTTQYVLERFQSAGAPPKAMAHYQGRLAARNANVFDGSVKQGTGNSMQPITADLTLDVLPRETFWYWAEELETKNVQRGPYGPAFTLDEADDPAYRDELKAFIRQRLSK